jgi:hypothetical protein
MIVVALPVLLLLMLGVIELGMRVYYKAQVRSIATAAALAAVGEQNHWPVPIPTKFIDVVPVDGFIINTLHLPDVDSYGGLKGGVAKVNELTNPKVHLDAEVLPWPYLPAPFKRVQMTATLNPPLVFSRMFRAEPITESACAMAWIRPDYWKHDWWTAKTKKSLFGIGNQDFRYFRLVPCEWSSAGDILEAVIAAHLEATGTDRRADAKAAWDEEAIHQLMPQSKPPIGLGPIGEGEVDECLVDPEDCRKPLSPPPAP